MLMDLKYLLLPLANLVSVLNAVVLIPFRRHILGMSDEECVGGRLQQPHDVTH